MDDDLNTAEPSPALRWRVVLRWVYLVAVTVAIVVAIAARWNQLQAILTGVDGLKILGGVATGLGGVGVSAMIWQGMMRGLGTSIPTVPALRLFFVAQLGKYLPGSVWPVVAQAELGRAHNVPVRTTVAAQMLFMWIHLITGIAVGVPVLVWIGKVWWGFGVAAVGALLLLHPALLTTVFDWALTRLGRPALPQRPSLKSMCNAVVTALAMWALYGAHVWLIAASMTVVHLTDLPVSIGLFAAAWAAGFTVLFAPAGAGAREVVMVLGLAPLIGEDRALAVTLVSRVVLTIADAVWAAAAALIDKNLGDGRDVSDR